LGIEDLCTMTSELGLNEHHTGAIINYLRFARFKRDQRLKVVDGAFEELKESRLTTDETFTADEVTSMLDGLCAVVKGDMESELINAAHTNALLLRQMFEQAEEWRLKLNADVSQLENKELIEEIARVEERYFLSSSVSKTSLPEKKRLQPLNELGGSALLHMEIERMKEENEQLRKRIQTVELKAY
jgi:leucine zipper transcription factor-like protein 1